MKGKAHVYGAGIQGGVVYLLSQSMEVSIITFLSGVLIDLDHVLDFLVFSGEKFTLKKFLSWCDEGRWERVSLIFHSYEVYLILAIITYYFPNNILLGLTYGIGFHLLLDQIWNCHICNGLRLFHWFYFLTYRIRVGFHKSKLAVF
jgi:hypothetical protein